MTTFRLEKLILWLYNERMNGRIIIFSNIIFFVSCVTFSLKIEWRYSRSNTSRSYLNVAFVVSRMRVCRGFQKKEDRNKLLAQDLSDASLMTSRTTLMLCLFGVEGGGRQRPVLRTARQGVQKCKIIINEEAKIIIMWVNNKSIIFQHVKENFLFIGQFFLLQF